MVVGLGNPGSQYVGTRHNVGFDVIDAVSAARGGGSARKKFNGEVCEIVVGAERVMLLKPLTFMNLSGGSVLAARDFHKLAAEDVLVICDDMNLPLGRLRVRANGSAGGQKGLADIIQRLGTDAVPRLRLGVGQPAAGRDAVGHVLGKFAPDEKPAVEAAVAKATAATIEWIERGIVNCMNKYNVDEGSGKKPKDSSRKTESPARDEDGPAEKAAK